MKYSKKILTAASAVALSVGLLIGYSNPVSAATSKVVVARTTKSSKKTSSKNQSSSNSDQNSSSSTKKRGPVQTSTSYDLMVKVGSGKKYGVYKKIVNGKPSKKVANANNFQYAHLQSDQSIKTQKATYWRIYVDGREVGYVNQNWFTRNKIAVPKVVTLVRNSHYNFDPTDAISYVTNYMGTVIDNEDVDVSGDMIDCSNPGTYTIKYTYGNAKAYCKVIVRKSTREGVTNSAATAQPFNKTLSSWKNYYGNSVDYLSPKDFVPERSRHSYTSDGGTLTLGTRYFQPVLLSVQRDLKDDDPLNRVGHIPEGISMSNGWLYTSLISHTYLQNGHIVAYNLNHLTNAFNGQYLNTMSQKQFNSYVKNIKVSPYLPVGHGQAMGSTKKYIYVINNDNKTSYNSNLSEELIQIRKSDMCINKIWTFKCWNGDDSNARYFQNGVVVDDHDMYTTIYNRAKKQTEYWEFKRTGDNWYPTMVGATQGSIVNNTYNQGFTYDAKHDNFYIAFNDVIAKIARDGQVKQAYQFHTGREIEGLAVDHNRLFVNMAQRAELFESTESLTN